MGNADGPEAPSRALQLREASRHYYYRHRKALNERSLEYARVKAQVKSLELKQQAASFARMRQETPSLPRMVWTPQQGTPSFNVQGLTKREKKKVKKRYQQYRRDLRRQLLEHGGKEALKEERGRLERLNSMTLKETDVLSDVEAHFRGPSHHEETEVHTCMECKEQLDAKHGAVLRHCMVFHPSCWEAVREGYFHRKQYLKCAVCGAKVRAEMV